MKSNYENPINIGSEEMVSINKLVEIVAGISGKQVTRKYKSDAPTGVRGRNSSNTLIREVLQWDYSVTLNIGITQTYDWINNQVKNLIDSQK